MVWKYFEAQLPIQEKEKVPGDCFERQNMRSCSCRKEWFFFVWNHKHFERPDIIFIAHEEPSPEHRDW